MDTIIQLETSKRYSFRHKVWRFIKRSASFCTKVCRSTNGVTLTDREMMYEKYSPNVKTFEVVGRKNSDSFERHSTQMIRNKLKEKTCSLSRENLETDEVIVNELPILIDELSMRIDDMKAELEDIENKIQWKKTYHENRSQYSGVRAHEIHCNLCGAIFSEPVVLNCGHIFCEWCISEHVLLTRTRQCPDCNEDITEMDASRMMQEFVATALDGISEKILQKYKLMEYSRAFLREQRQIRFCAKLTRKTDGYKSDWF